VPADRPRAEAFTASADVRGDRDLPVLIVSGPDLTAAVAELTGDLADGVITADLAEGPSGDAGPDRLAGNYSVALLNRGTPGSLVTPDGTLHIALMRASSAWPAGVWIDGTRRTPPDGSSFAWQHWSHEFRYALAGGAGDWREAGFVLAGQEYNHDLLACETGQHGGALPASASLGEVGTPGRDRPTALLSALKPRGNPLASGRPGRPERDAGVTIRLRDTGDLPAGAPAEVSLVSGITAAAVTGLTETGDGAGLAVTAAGALVPVPPAGLVTVTARTGAVPGTGRPDETVVPTEPGTPAEAGTPADTRTRPGLGTPAEAGTPADTGTRPEPGTPARAGTPAEAGAPGEAGPVPGAEPTQPVFTRYWLHGKGPAPAGNLPVTVHLSPGHIPLADPAEGRPSRAGRLRLSVAAGPGGGSGEVTLDVPPGLTVAGPDGDPPGPLRYALDAGCGYQDWELAVTAAPGTGPGRYFVAARIPGDLGQVLEDAVLVTVGEPVPPSRDMPREERDTLLMADLLAREAEVEVALEPAVLQIAPGRCATLAVRLANRTASVIRGESQLLSPFGTWDAARPWTQAFTAGPGETIRLGYTVAVPAGARPGSEWWALAKVMYFGRVRYTESAQLRVTG
jgi:hypothetical protein